MIIVCIDRAAPAQTMMVNSKLTLCCMDGATRDWQGVGYKSTLLSMLVYTGVQSNIDWAQALDGNSIRCIVCKLQLYNAPSECHNGLEMWLSGRTSVSERRIFSGLHRTCSWWVTIYMGKSSAVGQPTSQLGFQPPGINKWIVSCNQMDAVTSQWWRRLVNAYDVKAGTVCFSVSKLGDVIHTWALQRWASHNGSRYTNLCTFTFYLSQTKKMFCIPLSKRWRSAYSGVVCHTFGGCQMSLQSTKWRRSIVMQYDTSMPGVATVDRQLL